MTPVSGLKKHTDAPEKTSESSSRSESVCSDHRRHHGTGARHNQRNDHHTASSILLYAAIGTRHIKRIWALLFASAAGGAIPKLWIPGIKVRQGVGTGEGGGVWGVEVYGEWRCMGSGGVWEVEVSSDAPCLHFTSAPASSARAERRVERVDSVVILGGDFVMLGAVL